MKRAEIIHWHTMSDERLAKLLSRAPRGSRTYTTALRELARRGGLNRIRVGR